MTATPAVGDRYAFRDAPRIDEQMTALENFLDPVTTSILNRLPVKTGHRCLEIGAGGGSIAHWLADTVGPDGSVLAIDADTTRLTGTPNLRVVQADLRSGLPPLGRFDIIHARLVLLHLADRERILRSLAEALNPGGWLVIGEFSDAPLEVYAAPNPADRQLFTTVVSTLLTVLTEHGADMTWANRAADVFADTGLTRIRTIRYTERWTGATNGPRLHGINATQLRTALIDHGLTDTDIEEYLTLLGNPDFTARSYELVYTTAQRPAA